MPTKQDAFLKTAKRILDRASYHSRKFKGFSVNITKYDEFFIRTDIDRRIAAALRHAYKQGVEVGTDDINVAWETNLAETEGKAWEATVETINGLLGLGFGQTAEAIEVFKDLGGDFGTPTENDIKDFRANLAKLPIADASARTAIEAADHALRSYGILAGIAE